MVRLFSRAVVGAIGVAEKIRIKMNPKTLELFPIPNRDMHKSYRRGFDTQSALEVTQTLQIYGESTSAVTIF